MNPNESLSSFEVYQMPEYKALCDRLGIPWSLATQGIVIRLGAPNDLVEVNHTYNVRDNTKTSIDTTNLHNQEYKTYKPCQHPN